jgi:hypothetical protein
MLSNQDFRSLLTAGELRPKPTPPPPPQMRKPVSAWAVQRMAAHAVARAVLEQVPLRSSTGLSGVPAANRNAVFACASETLKSLARLRDAVEASALETRDDLAAELADSDTCGTAPRVRLSVACVLLHDLLGGRWLDSSQPEVAAVLTLRSGLLASHAAHAARASGSRDEEAEHCGEHGGEYLLFARVNALRYTVDASAARLRADGWREVTPLGLPQLGEVGEVGEVGTERDGGSSRSGQRPCRLHSELLQAGVRPGRAEGGRASDRCRGQAGVHGRAFSRDSLLPDVLVFPPGAAALRAHPLVQVRRDRGLLMISASFTYDGGHFFCRRARWCCRTARHAPSPACSTHQLAR